MFRTFVRILTVAAIALLPLLAHAQTVDEIIAKNIQARGGAEKMKSVQTIRRTEKIPGSSPFKFVQENKRPDKIRDEQIIQGMIGIQAYDGKNGWQVDPFGGRKDPELMSQDDLKGMKIEADIDGPLVDYKEKGHKAELIGHDSVEGTDCYKIKLSLANGDVRYYFLDTDSFLELKIENQTNIRGTIQYSETYFGDYEEVNGLYFPMEIESGEKGSTERGKLEVEKIEINVPMDDSLFSVPATKTAGGAQ